MIVLAMILSYSRDSCVLLAVDRMQSSSSSAHISSTSFGDFTNYEWSSRGTLSVTASSRFFLSYWMKGIVSPPLAAQGAHFFV